MTDRVHNLRATYSTLGTEDSLSLSPFTEVQGALAAETLDTWQALGGVEKLGRWRTRGKGHARAVRRNQMKIGIRPIVRCSRMPARGCQRTCVSSVVVVVVVGRYFG